VVISAAAWEAENFCEIINYLRSPAAIWWMYESKRFTVVAK